MRFFFITLLILVLVLAGGCQKGENTADSSKVKPSNIFRDKVLRDIYDLQNNRDVEKLHQYFTHQNPDYRKAAVIGAASVQSPGSLNLLLERLEDENDAVRSAAAYALGQLKNKDAEPALIESFGKQQNPDVKFFILEAVGKCGTAKGLDFILNLDIPESSPRLRNGQAMALYRFTVNGVVSAAGTELAFKLLNQEMPERSRLMAAHYLSRSRDIDLADFYNQLVQAFETEKNVFVRMALVQAMGKALKPEIKAFLISLLKSDEGNKDNKNNKNNKNDRKGMNKTPELDYRIKVNALRALGRFGYDDVKEIFFSLCSNSDVNIAVIASEFFTTKGTPGDAGRYFDTAKTLTNWRCRTNMITAALRHSSDDNSKKGIFTYIKEAYKNSSIDYEKATLLSALGSGIDNLKFLEAETMGNIGKTTVIGTYGVNALSGLCQRIFNGKNDAKNDKIDEIDEIDKIDKKLMLETFTGIFKKIISSDDSVLVAAAARMLREPKINFKEYIRDTAFLKTALDKCTEQNEKETQRELNKTIDYFNGTSENQQPATPEKKTGNKPIDWNVVASISPEQQVRIKTTKGTITIQMLVNQSPGSVANFISLIKEKFFEKSVFHRVVPNFVIQDGCPRGDGWGGPEFNIGSELGPVYYKEGSVGMASGGKDTEGSQWFITHSPTPHLDGSYSIFAVVVKGMHVVHKIEIGDKIIQFEIVNH
jgi:cyclophilin family peptidyl-prolyl cis-trans isomerase/HEAT repeat protein